MVKVLNEVDSTQLELKRDLEKNPELPDYYVVQAHAQTHGKGRQGRTWISTPGNLFFSILLRGPHADPTWMPHRVALVLLETLFLLGVSENRIQLKWPNDLLVDGTHKISGILCEMLHSKCLIAGVGLNLHPVSGVTDRPVASLEELLPGGTVLQGSELVRIFLQKIKKPLSLEDVQTGYQDYGLFKKGNPISWTDDRNGTSRQGTYLGLGVNGELRVLCNGETVLLFSEEVHLNA